MDNLKKPFDVMIIEEQENIKNSIYGIVENSPMPPSVQKLVLAKVFENVMAAIDQNIKQQKDTYYAKLADSGLAGDE